MKNQNEGQTTEFNAFVYSVANDSRTGGTHWTNRQLDLEEKLFTSEALTVIATGNYQELRVNIPEGLDVEQGKEYAVFVSTKIATDSSNSGTWNIARAEIALWITTMRMQPQSGMQSCQIRTSPHFSQMQLGITTAGLAKTLHPSSDLMSKTIQSIQL